MEKTYTVCMIIGITIPLITLVLGGIGDIFSGVTDGLFGVLDGLHVDFDINIGDTCICLLPISIQSICTGLLLFGTIGKVAYDGTNLVTVNVVAGVIGYLSAALIQTLIKKLKKVEHTTYLKEELILFDAKVINTIVVGGYGSISIATFDGITTTYPAKAENPNESIKQDSIVTIVRFDKNVAIVKDKDLTKKYDM